MAVKKFIKFDSEKGYLDNKDDINYFATNQMRKVAFGKMLGDFDENGLYVINEKIVEELIKMPKVVVEVLEEADLIRSTVKADAFFHFILTIEDNKASLKLLEKINYQSNRDFNSGVYCNINEYVLDEVGIPDKDFDRNALYQKYNISTDNTGDALSIFDMDELSLALYYNIIEKLKIDYLVQNELMLKEKELESVEADYFEAMLAILNEYKEFGDKVTTSVKNDLSEKHNFVIISKPFFQKTVNEVLDSYIDFYLQDLSNEQKEELLAKFREVKSQYYQKFKALIPIQIAQRAGVRFDASQAVEDELVDGLMQEIKTKGFTSSDVRRILIKDDELQLSIAKIKQMITENEEVCKRNNAKARDITAGRELTRKFYNELEKENQVDLLKPENLIKATIDKNAKEEKKQSTVASVSTGATKSAGATKPQQKGGAKSASSAKKENTATKGGSSGASSAKKSNAVKSGGSASKSITETKAEVKTETAPLIMYGTGTGAKNEKSDEIVDNLLEELMEDNHRIVKESSKSTSEETFVHAEVEEFTK